MQRYRYMGWAGAVAVLPVLSVLSVLWFSTVHPAAPRTAQVSATVETAPAPRSGDAADDPAIWVHPSDPSQSTIIGTIKRAGIAVYDLAGKQLQFLQVGRPNNVDLRYNFPLGGQPVDLVAVSERATNSIGVYRVDPATRKLENVAARTLGLGYRIEGFCMYHNRRAGKYYAIVTSTSGRTEQWELFDNGSGKVDGKFRRRIQLGGQSEGCVADDELARLYLAEEEVGIWRYGAEPDDTAPPVLVDKTDSGGHLTADVEGLTIYYASNGKGYLIASSQGASQYAVYRREENNAYVATFAIGAGSAVDAVTGTDGIDVTNVPLGSAFPMGVFVAQDDKNDKGNQNFKLVPWESVARAVVPPLTTDPAWNPRKTAGFREDVSTGDQK